MEAQQGWGGFICAGCTRERECKKRPLWVFGREGGGASTSADECEDDRLKECQSLEVLMKGFEGSNYNTFACTAPEIWTQIVLPTTTQGRITKILSH